MTNGTSPMDRIKEWKAVLREEGYAPPQAEPEAPPPVAAPTPAPVPAARTRPAWVDRHWLTLAGLLIVVVLIFVWRLLVSAPQPLPLVAPSAVPPSLVPPSAVPATPAMVDAFAAPDGARLGPIPSSVPIRYRHSAYPGWGGVNWDGRIVWVRVDPAVALQAKDLAPPPTSIVIDVPVGSGGVDLPDGGRVELRSTNVSEYVQQRTNAQGEVCAPRTGCTAPGSGGTLPQAGQATCVNVTQTFPQDDGTSLTGSGCDEAAAQLAATSCLPDNPVYVAKITAVDHSVEGQSCYSQEEATHNAVAKDRYYLTHQSVATATPAVYTSELDVTWKGAKIGHVTGHGTTPASAEADAQFQAANMRAAYAARATPTVEALRLVEPLRTLCADHVQLVSVERDVFYRDVLIGHVTGEGCTTADANADADRKADAMLLARSK
jgi:hypothetical protein